jgi:hypothetical protein
LSLTLFRFVFPLAVKQIFYHQAQARQEAEAKPTHSSVDQVAHWKHHKVRRGINDQQAKRLCMPDEMK